jgi:hypothetical protein
MGNGVQQTNCGLAWRLQWGSNRYAGSIPIEFYLKHKINQRKL